MISLNEERCVICQRYARSGEPWCTTCLKLPENIRLQKTYLAKARRRSRETIFF